MSRWFAANLGLMGLALLMAFVLWLFNSITEDPIVDSTIQANVTVLQPTDASLVINSSVPQTVSLSIRAPRSAMQRVGTDSARVTVDLQKLGVGSHVVQLEPALALNPAQLVSSRPVTASVNIERLAQRTLPVRLSSIGQPAVGYEQQDGEVSVKTAVVSATEQILARVTTIDAIVSVDEVRSSVAQRVRLVPRDQDGIVVAGASVDPSEAIATIPVEQLSNYRTLAVSVKTKGRQADNYSITSISAEPQTLTVFGNKDVIQKLPGFIETLEVNLEGATQSIEERVGLQVPAGVTLVGDNSNFSVQVRVRIEAQVSAATVSRTPVIIGLDNRLEASVSPSTVAIVLSGPLPKLNALGEQDVQVLLNVTNLGEGVHQVAPTIVKPDGLIAQVPLSTIQVELKAIVTPTPEGTLEATPEGTGEPTPEPTATPRR
jgi:YbbR domain-containing protein